MSADRPPRHEAGHFAIDALDDGGWTKMHIEAVEPDRLERLTIDVGHAGEVISIGLLDDAGWHAVSRNAATSTLQWRVLDSRS